jgi:peptide chain release factor 1
MEAFEKILKHYQELEQQLSDPAVASDRARFSKLAKEHGALGKQVKPYIEFKKLSEDLAQVDKLAEAETDPDMRRYYQEEQETLRPKKQALQNRLEELLLLDPSEDYDSIIMEIRAGTGGDEAALFAGDLYNMYTHYARDLGWKVEDISFSPGEQGGYKEVVFSVAGEDVFRILRFESGGHRVQRVPKTETQGRIHTSAATVAVMPEPDEVQVEIRPQDITREVMRAGGAGGQHVNKTESAVRLWYKKGTPDELEVKCQDERSQHKNEARAMRILRTRLFERNLERAHKERAEQRRDLIGSGDRSERIRTYNFPQNRVTDHRINLNLYKLDSIIAGEIGDVIQALRDYDRKQRLGEMGDDKKS